jgi:hypothetical protein
MKLWVKFFLVGFSVFTTGCTSESSSDSNPAKAPIDASDVKWDLAYSSEHGTCYVGFSDDLALMALNYQLPEFRLEWMMMMQKDGDRLHTMIKASAVDLTFSKTKESEAKVCEALVKTYASNAIESKCSDFELKASLPDQKLDEDDLKMAEFSGFMEMVSDGFWKTCKENLDDMDADVYGAAL